MYVVIGLYGAVREPGAFRSDLILEGGGAVFITAVRIV